jgi:hypothetical protein
VKSVNAERNLKAANDKLVEVNEKLIGKFRGVSKVQFEQWSEQMEPELAHEMRALWKQANSEK